MNLPLVEEQGYYRKKKFGYQLLLGIEPEGDIVNVHTKKLLRNLK